MDGDRHSLSLDQLKKRAVTSFVSLIFRQATLRAIGFLTNNIVLINKLPIATLGIFNIATAVVTFFTFFSDIGLAASLIQKKETLDDNDIKSTFTIQQLIVVSLSLLIIGGAGLIGSFYNFDNDGVWLIRSLGIFFFLSSLKVIPSVLLERELKFKPLVSVEVVENVVYNGLLIGLVFSDFGLWSFTFALLVRGVVGVVMIYHLAPVRLGFGIQKESVKKLLSFGLPYQLNSLIALLKDRLVPLVVAKMIGPAGVGYITWAQAMAFLPLEAMNVVIRITFPLFSRLQDEKRTLSQAIEKSLFITALVVYPLLFGLGSLLPALVRYILSSKVEVALPSFYLFAFSTLWAVVSTTLTNVLNALGYIKTTLKLMVFWTILTWILTPFLVWSFGFVGVGMSSFIISFTSIITIILVKRILKVAIIQSIFYPLICSVLMSVAVYIYSENLVRSKLSIIGAVLFGGVVYLSTIFLCCKERIYHDLKSLRSNETT